MKKVVNNSKPCRRAEQTDWVVNHYLLVHSRFQQFEAACEYLPTIFPSLFEQASYESHLGGLYNPDLPNRSMRGNMISLKEE